jgi:hypothetical protein
MEVHIGSIDKWPKSPTIKQVKICTATYFTKGWCYSVDSWLEHFAASAKGFSGNLIVSTDFSEECEEKFKIIKSRLEPMGWVAHSVKSSGVEDSQKAYKDDAQLIIARIQQKAFSLARDLDSDIFWSIESDVLVPPNALKVLLQTLEFDEGYYGIAMVTYPNGQFLGGRGSPTHPIAEDFKQDERDIPSDLKKQIKKKDERLKELFEKKQMHSPEEQKEWEELDKKIKSCPPKGNIFELQSKGWRQRGWMDSAYPAIGRGAILPTDWVGLGCTIMNKKALSLATFEGYELKGTQDLFLCWNRWHPADIKMCVIPHILCSHVKRKVGEDGKRTDEIEIHEAYHELTGEFVGHIRWRPRKYINFNA